MKKWSIYIIITAFPILLYAVILLEPTSDDWSYLTNPYFGNPFIPERIFPDGNHWRPFDALYGSLLSNFVWLYPSLNHIIILIAHCVNAYLVYLLSYKLFSDKLASNISTIYFFISPAVVGTLFGIDSINQATSQLFRLMSLYVILYIEKNKMTLWLILVFIAMLCKENGTSWAIIPSFMAYGLGIAKKKESVRYLCTGIIIIGIYMVLRFTLSNNALNQDSIYFDFSIAKKIRDLSVFLGMTWSAFDFVSIAHAPGRNLTLLVLSVVLSMPFIMYFAYSLFKCYKDKTAITLIICILIAAAPHLLTLFGAMHAYSSLGISALLLSYFIKVDDKKKYLVISFIIYSIMAIIVDYRHYIKSYESGMTGYHMAKQIVNKCKKQYNKVYIINIDDNYPSYSSFCVSPFDSFGWGNAVMKYNGYKWPKEVGDTVIDKKNKIVIEKIASTALSNGYDCVWLCNDKNISVIKEK